MNEPLLAEEGGLPVELAADTAINVKCGALRAIAETFSKNCESVARLLALPLTLLTVGETGKHRLLFLTEALILDERIQRGDRSKEVLADVEKRAEERRISVASSDSNFDAVKVANELLMQLSGIDALRRPLQTLLYSSTVYAWSALECALKDAWVTAVNLRPLPLGHRSIVGMPSESPFSGINAKQISVGLLAKHGFDLREKIGSMIAPKYDFTGINGIRAAYSAVFAEQPSIQEALSSPRLCEFEAVRHVIAHRAALIDEEFLLRLPGRGQLDEPLWLNEKQVNALVSASIVTTTSIIRCLDDVLGEAS
ncbi:MAG: hypothetical protein WCE61_03470 [Candidatus Acidiferrum sp.]